MNSNDLDFSTPTQSIVDSPLARPGDVDKDARLEKKSIFIWIDILGWAALVKNRSQDQNRRLIDNFRETFSMPNCSQLKIAHTSADGILLEVLGNGSSQFKIFNEAIRSIGNKQLDFILNEELFIRGGIIIIEGCFRTEQSIDMTTHPGLSGAHEIEKEHVCWPIIGTNKKNLGEMKKLFNINKEYESLELSASFNSGGLPVYFIDFLSTLEEQKDAAKLKKYYKILNDKFEKFRHREIGSILIKYIWLMRYFHNKFDKKQKADNLRKWVL